MNNQLKCSECEQMKPVEQMNIVDKTENMCYTCYDRLMTTEEYAGKDIQEKQ